MELRRVLCFLFSLLIVVAITSGIWLAIYFGAVKKHNDKKDCSTTTTKTPPTPTSSQCSYPPIDACSNTCELYLCESLPDGMTIQQTHNSTTQCWTTLLKNAKTEVKIGSYYWNLLMKDSGLPSNFTDTNNSSSEGLFIYNSIIETANRGIRVQIAQNFDDDFSDEAFTMMNKSGNIHVRALDFAKLIGSGIIHTKSWQVDGKHFYVGSANFDWLSLRHVKEIGVLGFNCDCLAKDIGKILDNYWDAGAPNATLPPMWPPSRSVANNHSIPHKVPLPNGELDAYFSSSPPQFNACGRENDIDAMVKVLDEAVEFAHLAVMDYIPATLYLKNNFYYSKLDNAIRRAAFRRVKVKFMMSKWSHTSFEFFGYLHSLAAINGSLPCEWATKYETCVPGTQGEIEVKIFQIPPFGTITDAIYGRVQHTKYFVTDKTAYIGTSNWSADYWLDTAGIGFVARGQNTTSPHPLVQQVQSVFMRDWSSQYATDISHFDHRGNLINGTNFREEL